MREKGGSRERGTVVVEAALVIPILVLLFLGIFEFGRILMVKQVITHAAREGVRAAAVKFDSAQALAAAQAVSENFLTRSGLDTTPAAIDPALTVVDGTEAVEVTIRYDYPSDLHRWIPGIPETIALGSRAVMRREA